MLEILVPKETLHLEKGHSLTVILATYGTAVIFILVLVLISKIRSNCVKN